MDRESTVISGVPAYQDVTVIENLATSIIGSSTTTGDELMLHLRTKSYPEILRDLGLSLQYRRLRFDIIQVYRLILTIVNKINYLLETRGAL